MGLYALLCTVDETRLDLFARLRAEHYGFLIAERDKIRFGGPTRIVEGGRPETMIIIVEAADPSDAAAWIAREPYNANGGFKAVVARPWSQVLPEPEPGMLERVRQQEWQSRPAG